MTAQGCLIVSRSGSTSTFNSSRLKRFLMGLCGGLSMKYLDIDQMTDKIAISLPEKVTWQEFLQYVSESLATNTTSHPDYSVLAGRVEAIKIQKLVAKSFTANISKLYDNKHIATKKHNPLVSPEVYEVVKKYGSQLDAAVKPERDFDLSYFGIKTLEKSYLIPVDGVVSETPQYLFMRVALGIHFHDIDKVIETYDLMSQKYFIHASPTLFNCGTVHNHLSSCFLVAMEDDSIDGIYKTLHKTAMISKASGGVGLHVHNVRARGSLIASSNGTSSGLVPMLKVFNDTARYVDQGGNKRPGAFAVYIEPWHADIFDMLDMKKNYGKEEMRARDLFYGLWVPDLFMEKVKNNEDWCLFSPDVAPGLADCHGDEFKKLYEKYEKAGMAAKTIKAQKLWQAILESQTETGGPYILYKDACNRKSNHQHLGTIKSSNLCCEIIEYTSKEETAVCNLGSVALPAFVKETESTLEFDFEKLHVITKVLGRNLDKVIDITKYPVESSKTSNSRHRPVAIGVQGLADTFALLRLPFGSPEAQKLNIQIFETIYHAAVQGSLELAKELGPYVTFSGSPASEGKLQFDLWNHKPSPLYDDWDILKNDIKKYGMRNSLLVAPMPTASTSQILGFSECFEPFTSSIYTRRVISGEFQIVNKYLVEDLIELGLWSKKMKDRILLEEGSIQSIPEIPDDIKQLYKTVWEIPQKVIVDMAADRGKFIDQSQSMNIYMRNPTFGKLTSCHFYSWSKGLKTGMYYLRTQAASKAIQFTVEDDKKADDKKADVEAGASREIERRFQADKRSDLKRKRYVEETRTITNGKKSRTAIDIFDNTVRYCKIDSEDCESCSG